MYTLKKYFLHSYKKYIVAFVLASVIFVVNVFNKGTNIIFNYINGLFIGGFAVSCIGGLSVLGYYGAYDFFSFAFYRQKAKMEYHEFNEMKENKRKNNNIPFVPYFVVGVFFILISLFLQVIYL